MIRTRLIIAAWLLLLVPTLLLGVGAWQLLRNEGERLTERERQAATERLAGVAGNLELAIAEVQDGIMQSLAAFPTDNLPELLSNWRADNPLVRNVFVWQAGDGLVFPDPERPASDEERQFVRRYLPLFSGELDWLPPAADLPDRAALRQQLAADTILSERKELRELASRAPAPATASEPSAAATAKTASSKSQWRSWYADDQLHLLGWREQPGATVRYGVELEMMALLSRLLGTLNPTYEATETLALVDGSGQIFHQSGSFEIDSASVPVASLDIDSLPHWSVRSYLDPAARKTGSGFLLIGSMLTGTFLVAILLGGALLLWQSIRQQRDARLKTSFVSNVSHELKTPLTTIRMYAELLEEGKIDSEQKQRNYLQTIVRESQRLTRLVNNILDFSRIEQNKKVYNMTRIDLTSLATEILQGQSLRLKTAGLICETELPAGALEVRADRDALEQILLNLIDNGIKYAAEGRYLHLALRKTSTQSELLVSDRGPGIPADQQQRIFDKFHRLDTSLTSAQAGTGLGLSIARPLARDMGGELRYVKTGDKGSCFCLSLPLEGDNA